MINIFSKRIRDIFNNKENLIPLIIFIGTVIVYSLSYAFLINIESSHGDFDHNPQYQFPVLSQDSPDFVRLADSILYTGIFKLAPNQPEVFRTPGYPLFMTIIKCVFGNYRVVPLFQILLVALSAILIFRIGKKIATPLVGTVAAVLYVLSPSTIFHSFILLTDSLFTSLIVITIYLLFFRENKLNIYAIGATGFLLGFATLVRPIGLYISILFLVFFIFYQNYYHADEKRKVFIGSACFLILFIGTLLPWSIRNKIIFGRFAISTINVFNLAYYNVPDFLSAKFGSDSVEFKNFRSTVDSIPSPVARSFQEYPRLKSMVMQEIKNDPFGYLKFHILGTSKFFLSSNLRYVVLSIQYPIFQEKFGLNLNSPDLLSLIAHNKINEFVKALKSQPLISLDRLWMIFVSASCFISMILFTKRKLIYGLLFSVIILCVALLTGPVSIPRYRLPVDPFIFLLISYLWCVSFPDVFNNIKLKIKKTELNR